VRRRTRPCRATQVPTSARSVPGCPRTCWSQPESLFEPLQDRGVAWRNAEQSAECVLQHGVPGDWRRVPWRGRRHGRPVARRRWSARSWSCSPSARDGSRSTLPDRD
jgi:hypothetical protein